MLVSLFITCFISLSAAAQSLTSRTPYDQTGTLSAPTSVPMRFNLDGRMTMRFSDEVATTFPLMTQGAWEWQNYEFIPALVGSSEKWVEADASVPRLKVKRHRVEAGAGVGGALRLLSNQAAFSASLIPYKGGSFESRTFKKPSDGWFSLPLDATAWSEWSVAEGRDYQLYGGLSFTIGAAALGLNLAQVYTQKQSRWSLGLEKISPQYLRLRIRRDDWKKLGGSVGPLVSTWERAVMTYFDRERVYLLDMYDPAAFEGLRALWKGRLDELQSSAAVQEEESRRTWTGSYHARYLGIPFLWGTNTARVRLSGFEVAGVRRELGILNLQTTSKGVMRENDPQVWTVVHEPEGELFYFLALSQSLERGSMGVREKLGKWLDRIGVQLTWPRLSKKDFLDARLMFALPVSRLETWREQSIAVETYHRLCASRGLTCQSSQKAHKTIARWNELRALTGAHRLMQTAEFLIRHPLLWGLILSERSEQLTMEFMAHAERWLPVQKILTTEPLRD